MWPGDELQLNRLLKADILKHMDALNVSACARVCVRAGVCGCGAHMRVGVRGVRVCWLAHWLQMYGFNLVSTNIHGYLPFKWLHRHTQDVSDAASREHALERTLDKMQAEWTSMKFELVPWKDTGGFILKVWWAMPVVVVGNASGHGWC